MPFGWPMGRRDQYVDKGAGFRHQGEGSQSSPSMSRTMSCSSPLATVAVRRARCLPLGGEVVAVKIMNMVHLTESDVVRMTLDLSLVINHSLIIYNIETD